MYVVLNKDTIKNEILSQISVTKCGRVSKAVCMNFISYKLKAEWDCRLRGRRKRKTANALYLVDSPSPCLPPNSGNIMMHTTAWKDVTCDYSFGYVGKFDKKKACMRAVYHLAANGKSFAWEWKINLRRMIFHLPHIFTLYSRVWKRGI